MPLSPFASRDGFARSFYAGLAAMLEAHAGLGVYILVLANALQDPGLWSTLRDALARRHEGHRRAMVEDLRRGCRLREPEDDLSVFLKLLAIGFEHLAPVERRRVEGAGSSPAWEIQFNPIRALRPARMSDTRVEGVMRPFDACGFHFNKPFLAREVFWEGVLAGKPARLLYNKFPFAPMHGLLVPEPEKERPQFLTPELQGWAWEVARSAGEAIPGFGLAYNSYGAHASVNHLHFQTFARETPLAAQEACEGYPLARHRHEDMESAWFQIDELHQRQTAYNLVYDRDGLLLIPRARQGETTEEAWSSGFAWSEVAGAFPIASRDDYDGLTHTDLRAALARLTV
jgi:diadenosine tetraphosphate (Ap4A) HIT family hydrolase